MIAQPALAVLGVLAFSAEGVTGPVRTTFAVPRRWALQAAKAATAGAVALAARAGRPRNPLILRNGPYPKRSAPGNHDVLRLVRRRPAHDGGQHRDVRDPSRAGPERVLRQHHEVGELARLE